MAGAFALYEGAARYVFGTEHLPQKTTQIYQKVSCPKAVPQ
jgi:hypothetical protein